MNQLKLTSVSILFSITASAQVQEKPVDYSIILARVHVNMVCIMNQLEDGATDCDMQMSSRGKHTITMSGKKGTVGFSGHDIVGDAMAQNTLLVSAKADKTIENVTLIRTEISEDGKSINSPMSTVTTNSVIAVDINPLTMEMISDHETKVTVGMVAYGPVEGNNIATTLNKRRITEYVLQKIKPAITAARRMQPTK